MPPCQQYRGDARASSQLWKRRSRTSGGTHCVILLFASSRSLNAVTRTNQLGVACGSARNGLDTCLVDQAADLHELLRSVATEVCNAWDSRANCAVFIAQTLAFRLILTC